MSLIGVMVLGQNEYRICGTMLSQPENEETDAIKLELENAKRENASLQLTVESLRWQLKRAEQSYTELAEQKFEMERQKNRRDTAAIAALLYGVPLGGLAICALIFICKHFGLFQGFFHRFSENAEGIAFCACVFGLSYIVARLYLWLKDEPKR